MNFTAILWCSPFKHRLYQMCPYFYTWISNTGVIMVWMESNTFLKTPLILQTRRMYIYRKKQTQKNCRYSKNFITVKFHNNICVLKCVDSNQSTWCYHSVKIDVWLLKPLDDRTVCFCYTFTGHGTLFSFHQEKWKNNKWHIRFFSKINCWGQISLSLLILNML